MIAVKNSVTKCLEGHLRNSDFIPEMICTMERGGTGQDVVTFASQRSRSGDHVGDCVKGVGRK